MATNDTLADALSAIHNSEKKSKEMCNISQSSKTIKKVLSIMKDLNYIEEFKEIETDRGNFLKVKLLGNINKCGVIKPRTPIKKEDYEKYEKRYLPSKNMGILIVSTPEGMITNKEARKKGVGGRMIAYCY